MSNEHIPVLSLEMIEMLNIKANGTYVDCTAGRGGHSMLILKKIKNGKLICIDCDHEAIEYLTNKFKNNKNVIVIRDNFSNIIDILKSHDIQKVDGIIADLGVSSPMFDNLERGFSYHQRSEIDMRMDHNQKLDAKIILNTYSSKQLNTIFKEYGEIIRPDVVVNNIIKYREQQPIKYTDELVKIIKDSLPLKILQKSKHPAKQYFQALRIAVNDELNNLKKFITSIAGILNNDGKVAIITFHSLEDRIVKQGFNQLVVGKVFPKEVLINTSSPYSLINKKPIIASEQELLMNNRAHSAKLRGLVYHG